MTTPDNPGPQDPADGPIPAAAAADEVLDLTDAEVLATGAPEVRREGEQVVIDLRELAPTGRRMEPHPKMTGRPPDMLPGFTIERITGGDRWMAAEAFVYGIYVELGYTHESSTQQVEELARFNDRSTFHAVVSPEGEIVGTTRAIFGGYDDLPVGKFERVDFEDEDPMCELSSIVVDPRVRSIGFIEHLYRAGWADALRGGANAITGLGEKWLLDSFRQSYGLPFVPTGIPEYYMGGDVIPMVMSLKPEAAAEISRVNPDFWAWSLEALTAEEIDAFGYRPTVPAGSSVAQRGGG